MIVRWYSRQTADDLVAAFDAADGHRSGGLLLGGSRGRSTAAWRHYLHRAAANGRMTAIGLRTATDDPVLTHQAWADITRRLADHSGLRDTSWVAVRTGERSAVLFTPDGHRPEFAGLLAFTAAIQREYGLAAPGGAGAGPPVSPPGRAGHGSAGGQPMRILDAVDVGGYLAVLVDRIPDLAELRFTAYPVLAQPAATLYVAVHAGGYVNYFYDSGTGQGFGGRSFDLQLTDGTRCTVFGPESGRPEVVARHAPDIDIHLGEVTLHTDRERFAQMPGGGRVGALTSPAADIALALANRPGHVRPAGLRAFPPLRTITRPTDPPPPSGPPPQPGHRRQR